MLWIKRNLFLAAGGLVALALLGWGGYYLWTSIKKNSEVEAQLNEKTKTLEGIYNRNPFPNAANISAAKQDFERVGALAKETEKNFKPIPHESVKGAQALKTLLANAIFDLRKQASQAGIGLPSPNYTFSFGVEDKALNFLPESFPALSAQLGEIKTICNVLFAAKINALANLQRELIASTPEATGSPDYHGFRTETNEMTGSASTPYLLTFHCFSSDLAAAMEGFYKSPHGFVIKWINIEPAPASSADPGMLAAPAGISPVRREEAPVRYTGKDGGPAAGFPVGRYPTALPAQQFRPPTGSVTPGRDGLVTVLIERPLRVSMLLHVVKAVN